MLSVLIQSLILASGGIVSVGSITLVILLLISDKGWRNGLGYMLGYTLAYSLIGVAVVTLGFNATTNNFDEPSLFGPILFIVLGGLLLWITTRNWRKPAADPADNTPPRLFTFVDKTTPLKAFAFGMMVSVVNFKNLAIFLSAVSVVHLSNMDLSFKIINVLLVALVFCLSVIVPVLIYVLFPKRSGEALNWIKQTLETNSRSIGIWLPLVFGLIFLIRGIEGLL
ncbi:MAG TPA: GAP family protein [Anaerolineales bacterium]|nr:GAP family protein [Anaerolineales bacterium]